MQSKLAAIFQGPPTALESEAIDNLANGFTAFFLDATVAAVPALSGPLAGPEAQFRAAAVGLSAPGQSAARVQAAISAYWAAAMLAAPTIWVTVPVILPGSGLVPPGLGGIAAALSSVFATNVASGADLATASANAAAALMPTQAGATVTLSPPPPGGTPAVPVV